jgi:hypothetical protein
VITFWITVLLIPMLVVVGNVFIRWALKLEPGSLADVILAFLVFDALVIIDHQHFEQYIRNDELRAALVAIYVLLLFINFGLWFLAVGRIEKMLNADYDRRSKKYKALPWRSLGECWTVQAFVIFANLASFAYKA